MGLHLMRPILICMRHLTGFVDDLQYQIRAPQQKWNKAAYAALLLLKKLQLLKYASDPRLQDQQTESQTREASHCCTIEPWMWQNETSYNQIPTLY